MKEKYWAMITFALAIVAVFAVFEVISGASMDLVHFSPWQKTDCYGICDKACTYILKVSQIVNSTAGFSQDKIMFTDLKSDNAYEVTITSEGMGVVAIGGKQYAVKYFGASIVPEEDMYIELTSPEGEVWKAFKGGYIAMSGTIR